MKLLLIRMKLPPRSCSLFLLAQIPRVFPQSEAITGWSLDQPTRTRDCVGPHTSEQFDCRTALRMFGGALKSDAGALRKSPADDRTAVEQPARSSEENQLAGQRQKLADKGIGLVWRIQSILGRARLLPSHG